jgi:hypothetical protein
MPGVITSGYYSMKKRSCKPAAAVVRASLFFAALLCGIIAANRIVCDTIDSRMIPAQAKALAQPTAHM